MSLLATITGNLVDLYDNAAQGRVVMQLIYPNGSPVQPDDLRIPGVAIIATRGAVSTIAGTFTISVLGNDVIADLANDTITYWNVTIIESGSNTPVWWGTYQFNSNSTYNLDSVVPIAPPIGPVVPVSDEFSFVDTTPEVLSVTGTSATCVFVPNGAFEMVTKNGLSLQPGVDFTLSVQTFTFTVAAVSGDVYLFWYTH